MTKLHINGKRIEADGEKSLMEVLRKDMGLTSVKDGCSEGACGTCTVLVDGKPIKACVQKAERFSGKEIITVEGLSEEEKECYVYAFGSAGAVQCGFCIPGMVLCTKALLDQNDNPTRKEIAQALRGNLCRCTGYQKIMEAVELSAKLKREGMPVIKAENVWKVGESPIRLDVEEKVLGKGLYADDIKMEDMLYGSAVRSAYPRARICSIDTKAAKELQGVAAVLTAEDIPGENKVGHLKKDWDTMIPVGGITRYLGDAVCLIAAETKEILEQAKRLVVIEYEPLPGVFAPVDAMREDAPLVHEDGNILSVQKLIRGNAKKVMEESAYVVTNEYSMPFTEHAFLEPECAVAGPWGEDGLVIYSSDQGVYDTCHECAGMLGMPPEKIHVKNMLVGGGFGGKEDMSVQHHAALLAYYTKRYVKVKFSREESIQIHPKRHACEIKVTTGCDKEGNLTALIAEIITDTGAYASLGGPVLQRACTHAAGPYHFEQVEIIGKAVYTNNPPGGAFRGFGVTQSCFASECNLNQLAGLVGISPWEIRYKNAIRPGEVLPNGQIAGPETALAQTLEAVKEIYDSHPYAGVACAMKNAGVGVGIADIGRVLLQIDKGKVHIRSGASCIGQGLGTVLKQMVCEVSKLKGEDVTYEASETIYAPDSGTTSGSRQTLLTGQAAKIAAEKLKEELVNKTLKELEGREFYGEYLAKTDAMGSDKKNPISHIAYGYATQVVLLKEDGTLEKVIAAHDVGRAIHPKSVEGQIEGGVVMSLGYALTEDFPLKEGKPLAKLGTLGLFRADKVPPIESILVEKNASDLAFGAIGVGEITAIPTASAVQGAYYKLDGEFRKKLPLENTAYRKNKI